MSASQDQGCPFPTGTGSGDRAGGWEMEEGQENILGTRLLEALSHCVEPQLDSDPGSLTHPAPPPQMPSSGLNPIRKEFLRSILRSGLSFCSQ